MKSCKVVVRLHAWSCFSNAQVLPCGFVLESCVGELCGSILLGDYRMLKLVNYCLCLNDLYVAM